MKQNAPWVVFSSPVTTSFLQLFSFFNISSAPLSPPYLHSLSPVITAVPSCFSSLLSPSLSLLLSLRNQMCSLYDLFRCRDWGWESAAGRMHSAWVQMLEYPPCPHSRCKLVFLIYLIHLFIYFFVLKKVASLVWTRHNHSYCQLIARRGENCCWGESI